MPDMSSDQIRDVAVRCVEGFLNDKVPLSTGLAKEASANNMNVEQIKRACEVANTVTHLKLMQLSDDRTIEFPLCKVAEVMQTIVSPESAGVEKVASVQSTDSIIEPGFTPSEISDHEKTVHFIKEAAANEKALEALQDRAIVVQSELTKVAAEIRKDTKWLDKMSCVSPENFTELSVLVSGQVAQARDFGGAMLFKEAELKNINSLVTLYKEAKAIVAETAKRKVLYKRAEDLSQTLVKQAFLTGLSKTVGKAIGSTVGKTAKIGVAAAAGTAGLAAKGLTHPVGMAAASDSLTHMSMGGAGVSRSGASKDVWDALQN